MQASSRTVYARTFRVTPFWMWILQRLAGVLLGPLVLLHAWNLLGRNYALVDGLLLVCIVAHGYSGLCRVAPKQGKVAATRFAALVWAGIVLVFGIALIASYA